VREVRERGERSLTCGREKSFYMWEREVFLHVGERSLSTCGREKSFYMWEREVFLHVGERFNIRGKGLRYEREI